jgi:class 3 adenylate cyclase/DNA-binding winged helix-turn-helix (wHTH) protein/predicted ATPase
MRAIMHAARHWLFPPFRLDVDNACLWRGDLRIPLKPKSFAVLHQLVAHAGRLVTQDALFAAVWPETAVGDAVLKVCIAELRKALGDTAKTPRFIATVHRRGYRFVAPVVEYPEAVPGPSGAPLLETSDTPHHHEVGPCPPALPPLEAERRPLTVLFCDLVGSTALAGRLDPEDYREVVRAYHQVCAEVMQRFDGYLAQYLGDGVLVYFGYPVAHEDDAQRAVRAGLDLLDACASLSLHPALPAGEQVAVRLGVHTGLVVVGDVGAGTRHEPLALGETPNIAARLQHLAEPNTLVISAATQQLVAGYFRWKALGAHTLPGLAQPMEVYRVLGTSGAQSRLEVAATRGLTPLVGRVQEVGLLRACWTRVTEGMGQVVIVGGEAGIGKSRLVQVLKAHVAGEGHPWLECQGSPYYQHTALYPLTELLARRLLHLEPEATAAQQAQYLEEFLVQYDLSLAETVPLLAPLLSLPLPATYAPVQVTSEQQRQQTLHALLELLLRLAAVQPLLLVIEDLHWVDPTTLEWLSLLVDQGPTARILTLCTCRPDFRPPWTGRSHLTQMTLARLSQDQATELTHQVAHGKALPAEVVAQIVTKTDGVPLFVEEVTKTVLESGLLQEQEDHYALIGPLPPLVIPVTLHEALLARLDRLGAAKGLAQLGATLGREFAYALLRAVAPWDEATVRRALQQLVEAELLYQRGLPPQATYVFKHALIQEAAYESLLKRTRQQYHQHIAQVLEAQFPEIVETQPELLAHHYTAAGDQEHAVGYWQRAGERALQRSAYLEAVQHLTRGLQVLATLPHTLARDHQELTLQMPLGLALMSMQGQAALEVEQTFARAQELCAYIGETPQLFQTLQGLWRSYSGRGALPTARKIAEQLLRLAQRVAVPALLLEAHGMLGNTLFYLGDYAGALVHHKQGPAFTDPTMQGPHGFHLGVAAAAGSLAVTALTLWCLGYPTQAAQKSQEALALARTLAHPYSMAVVQHWAAYLHHHRREPLAVQVQVDTLLPLATAQGFSLYAGYGICWQGWVLAMQGKGERGIAQLHRGMAAVTAAGQTLTRPLCLLLLAEAGGYVGQVEESLRLLVEALTALAASGRGDLLAEVYRVQGEFLLRQSVPDPTQAEACFQQALTIARRQQAKSWELRAAMSLSRLWQQQGKRKEARQLLVPIYGWFTEGFDTADLQEARALLEELGR